jgi:hypothetical protein
MVGIIAGITNQKMPSVTVKAQSGRIGLLGMKCKS